MTYLNNTDTTFKSYPKAVRSIKKKSGYKRPLRSNKAKNSPKTALRQGWGYKTQMDMFDALWSKAKKEGNGKIICPFTGKDITPYENTDMSFWLSCFLHILSKKQYPTYKLNPGNIVIANPAFHAIVDQGRLFDRVAFANWKWDVWDKLVESKKVEYAEFIKANV